MGATAHEAITATLRRAAGALAAAELPFMLGGSMGCWARGGPQSQNDLDLMLPAEDAERALGVLVAAGMRPERPPEAWLLKAYDGEVMIDLIHESLGVGPITRAMVAQAEHLPVLAIEMPVMSLEDILAGKLLAISEQRLDYGPPLEIARALREQIDWGDLARRTERSPYARTFFSLLRELGVLPARTAAGAARGPAALGEAGAVRSSA